MPESVESKVNVLEFPMWEKDRKLMLSDVLAAVVAPDTLGWRLQHLEATGKYPVGRSMEEFENRVASEPMGLEFDYSSLIAFADGLTDLMNISLSGQVDNLQVIEIVAEDSTQWVVTFLGDRFRLDDLTSGDAEIHKCARMDRGMRDTSLT